MIQKFEVRGVHVEIDSKLKEYVSKKIGTLDKYLPRHDRLSLHGEVYLKENQAKGNQHYECEVTLFIPHQNPVVVHGTAITMQAAVDVARDKLKKQLMQHKNTHASSRFHRHIIARFRRRQSG